MFFFQDFFITLQTLVLFVTYNDKHRQMIPITTNVARPKEGAKNLVAPVLLVRHNHEILFENMRLPIDNTDTRKRAVY